MADINTAPTVSGSVTLEPLREDGVRTITAAELLANATDESPEELTVVDLKASSGDLQPDGVGGWIFTPDPGDISGVTFTYKVSDGPRIRRAILINSSSRSTAVTW